MYMVSFINFKYTITFQTMIGAAQHMRDVRFESVLHNSTGRELAYNSPITGFRWTSVLVD